MDLSLATALFADLRLPRVLEMKFLDKGFSTDRKYVLRTDGGEYLLRVSPLAEAPRRGRGGGVVGTPPRNRRRLPAPASLRRRTRRTTSVSWW